ncbi:hypothetical protein B0T26DRAFT_815310 [Lasiosphaeria miniovina]|uniref:Uncharacterized protein n=1 Tax=Lasiosphaeria miniovina TaxID=1954250 RepID=A0AA39ZT17_9PEZI|nr:uncharacterized protein B0T26DRAFT_815310 [Lasiosphaeria miniovina]KAK0703091.1 hypothetical protein B0T26DRAFT_815310 [Lasiosphaeria miniovina]
MPTSTVRFTNMQDLFDAINSTTGDFLAVTGLSRHFTESACEREKRRRKFRVRRYNSTCQILFITILADLYEELHAWIFTTSCDQLVRSGRERSWRSIGLATRRVEQGHPGGDGGEGDPTGGPHPERGNKGAWPTLVIEAGHSESLGELHYDMRWWFSTSDHQVKIVLLAEYDHTRSVIILEMWEGEAQTHGTIQQTAALQPILQQSIAIAQNTTTNPVSYNVTRGALIPSFRLLLIQDPGPGEADFVFSVPDLEDYGAMVWRQV